MEQDEIPSRPVHTFSLPTSVVDADLLRICRRFYADYLGLLVEDYEKEVSGGDDHTHFLVALKSVLASLRIVYR